MSPIQLNAFTFSDPHSLFVSLTSLLILSQDHLNKILFRALVDSGSTHCFVDSKFVDTHHLKTSTTPSVVLCLFDGSSNSTVFTFQTFRLTPQNLQKLLISPISLLSIMNLPMFSAKLKLKFLLLIILMTLKSIWKKVFNLWLALYTLFWYSNKRLWRNSLRKISTQVSSDQSHLCTVY